MPGEVFEIPGPDETYEPKSVLVRVAPGQSEEMWGAVVRACYKAPGGIGEIHTTTLGLEEAADFRGLASIEILDNPITTT